MATFDASAGSGAIRKMVSASGVQRFASLKFFDATIAWIALTILLASFLFSGEGPFFSQTFANGLSIASAVLGSSPAAMASCASAIHQPAAA